MGDQNLTIEEILNKVRRGDKDLTMEQFAVAMPYIKIIKKLPIDAEASFDNNKAVIAATTEKMELPPYQNEHFLCRAMFSDDIAIGAEYLR